MINSSTSIPSGTSAATLKIDASASAVTLAQTGSGVFTLAQGGLLKIGTNQATITGGDITSNTNEIDAYVQAGDLEIASSISDQFRRPCNTALVKSGPGTLTIGSGPSDTVPSNYFGTTYVQQGVLELNKASGTFAIRGNISITGGTLVVDQPNEIDTTAGLTVLAGAFNVNSNSTFLTASLLGGNHDRRRGVGPYDHQRRRPRRHRAARQSHFHHDRLGRPQRSMCLPAATANNSTIFFQGTNPSIIVDPGFSSRPSRQLARSACLRGPQAAEHE